MDNYDVNELMQFMNENITAYHAIENISNELGAKGFCEFCEKEIWNISKGEKGYCIRNGSSLIAFKIPYVSVDAIKGFHIFAAHADSPAFKIKENPEMTKEGVYVCLNTEKYGGMIMNTWLDRPLTIAGRVCVLEDGDIKSYNVKLKDNICMIPNLAIHMNIDVNSGVALNAQTDMLPLITMISDEDENKFSLNRLLAEELNIKLNKKYSEEDILASDIFIENCQKAVLAGANDEFIMTPRYDDLACVFAGLKSFEASESDKYIDVLAVFDNEEVGSLTRQGADSTFLKDTLENIADGIGIDARIFRTWKADSFMISADNAHACHPNQAGKADPVNKPYLNKGIVLKYHGGQKYATDAYSSAFVKRVCKEENIPYQIYTNRSDIAGGSTLGNLSMAQVSMAAADIGLPQLAMHSSYETAGVKDMDYMIKLVKRFFEI